MQYQLKILVTLAAMITIAVIHAAGSTPTAKAKTQTAGVSTSADQAADARGTPSEAVRDDVMKWLDQYLTKQVLFNKQDLEALRSKVASMSPDELKTWLDTTKEIRALLESDEWRSTRVWLEGYLPQRFYSDRQIKDFRADVAKLSPSQLHELLERIKQKHETLQSVYAAVDASAARELQAQQTAQVQQATRMNWQRNYLQGQESARRAAAQRSQSRSTRPLYGRTQAYASRRHQESERRYNQPLVTSRQAARRAVYGGFRSGW